MVRQSKRWNGHAAAGLRLAVRLGRGGLLLAGLWLAACAGGCATSATPTPAGPATLPILSAPTAVVGTPPTFFQPGASPPAVTGQPLSTATPLSGAAPTAAPTTVAPNPTQVSSGCPAPQPPTSAGAAPDVVVGGQGGTVSSSASLAVGQVLEVRLGGGTRWALAQNDPARALAPATPNGWFEPNPPACVWRFTGHAPGTVALSFTGRPICAPGSICPQFVVLTDIQVTVKG